RIAGQSRRRVSPINERGVQIRLGPLGAPFGRQMGRGLKSSSKAEVGCKKSSNSMPSPLLLQIECQFQPALKEQITQRFKRQIMHRKAKVTECGRTSTRCR